MPKSREPMQHVAIVAASVLLVMQLIRPERNVAANPPRAPFAASVAGAVEVEPLLRRSCYDCHSSTTVYPWYAEVQPVGWWLADHIDNAKRELNFDEFGSYRPMRKFRKLEEIASEIEKDAMPLPSYLIMHGNARLAAEEKQKLISWVNAAREDMKSKYPPDSLQRKR